MTGQVTLDVLPPPLRLDGGGHHIGVRYVPYGGPAVVPHWATHPGDRPRVLVTKGLTAADPSRGHPLNSQDILDRLAELDVELIVTMAKSEADTMRRVPPGTRIVPYVPLDAVLPTCAAVIHHAGVGTLLTAARHGVPQLMLPWDVDQPLLARKTSTLGAGLHACAHEVDGSDVRDLLTRLLTDSGHASGARRLQEAVEAMPTAREVVPELERLAATDGTGLT